MTYTKTPHGRSWHVVKQYEPEPKTRCGHAFDPDGETTDQLPVPSCEHCLRWLAREVDKQVA